MSREHIEQLVEKLVADIITETKLELVDVEYIKEREWYLRVFLDKEGGMDIEDCQWVSERLEARLDELDPIQDSYYLEVSSPGLDRPLKKERDFVRHAGDKIELHTFAPFQGKKDFVGILKALVQDEIHVEIDGTELSIPRDKVSQVRLYLEF
jgi:ribosome maturation factor RimP